jgi:hypothetical protein
VPGVKFTKRKICHGCRKLIDQRRNRVNKENLQRGFITAVDKIKAETPCYICERKYHPICMDMDHINPYTKVKLNGSGSNRRYHMLRDGVDRLMEVCRVICGNCHNYRTYQEGQRFLKQPTQTMTDNPRRKYRVNRAERARNFVRSCKIGKKCKDCELPFHPVCLSFICSEGLDIRISNIVSMTRTISRIQTEINKCDIVCVNCVRLRQLPKKRF